MKKNNLILFTILILISFLVLPEVVFAEGNFDPNVCNNPGVTKAVSILGKFLYVLKIVVPMIIIVLGMVDFGKATISSDEAAIKKATGSLVRRVIAGFIIFFIPTIVIAIINAVDSGNNGINSDILDNNNASFGQCTKCLFDPFNSCK